MGWREYLAGQVVVSSSNGRSWFGFSLIPKDILSLNQQLPHNLITQNVGLTREGAEFLLCVSVS
jgi:hypothetical protein